MRILEHFLARVHAYLHRRDQTSMRVGRTSWRCPSCDRLFVGEAVQRGARLFCTQECSDWAEVTEREQKLRAGVTIVLLAVAVLASGCEHALPSEPTRELTNVPATTPTVPPSAIIRRSYDPAVCMAPPFNCKAGVVYCDELRNDNPGQGNNFSCTSGPS